MSRLFYLFLLFFLSWSSRFKCNLMLIRHPFSSLCDLGHMPLKITNSSVFDLQLKVVEMLVSAVSVYGNKWYLWSFYDADCKKKTPSKLRCFYCWIPVGVCIPFCSFDFICFEGTCLNLVHIFNKALFALIVLLGLIIILCCLHQRLW